MYNDSEDLLTILTVAEVAELLYVGKNRVYELLASGELQGFRMGHVWKIPKESLASYIRKCTGLER